MKKKVNKKKLTVRKNKEVQVGFLPLDLEDHPLVKDTFPQGIELLHTTPNACFYGPLTSNESKGQYKGLAAIKALEGDDFEGKIYFL